MLLNLREKPNAEKAEYGSLDEVNQLAAGLSSPGEGRKIISEKD